MEFPLISLCYGRSGDKGDSSNIGIICRRPEYFPFLKKYLTSKKVKEYLNHFVNGKVIRYELPGTFSFNFVLTKSLGGGGLSSLRVDRQGKCYAQVLLTMPIEVPFDEWSIKLLTNKSNINSSKL